MQYAVQAFQRCGTDTALKAEPIEFITDLFQDLPKPFIQNP